MVNLIIAPLLSTWLGFSCLHCMSPAAKPQALQVMSVMRDSRRPQVITNLVMDDSFGTDLAQFESYYQVFTRSQQQRVWVLFLGNGSHERKCRTYRNQFCVAAIRTHFKDYLKRLARTALRVRPAVLALLNDPIPSSDSGGPSPLSLGGNVAIIIPVLEDNLTDEEFRQAALVISNIYLPISGSNKIALGRSACPGCASGNGKWIPDGFFYETVATRPGNFRKQALVTNDGEEMSLNIQSKIAHHANFYISWSCIRQGGCNGLPETLPYERTYPLLSNRTKRGMTLWMRQF
jgi:hypothetical protein